MNSAAGGFRGGWNGRPARGFRRLAGNTRAASLAASRALNGMLRMRLPAADARRGPRRATGQRPVPPTRALRPFAPKIRRGCPALLCALASLREPRNA